MKNRPMFRRTNQGRPGAPPGTPISSMNRKQRRAAQKQAKKQLKQKQPPFGYTLTPPERERLRTVHRELAAEDALDAERGAQRAAERAALEERVVDAVSLQDRVQGVIADHFKDSEVGNDEVAHVVQVLGMTAAGLATGIGIGEAAFADAMRTYVQQVRQAVGLPQEEPPPPAPEAPLIVLP